MPTITLRLDDRTKEELEALARGRGESLSDVIRSAISVTLLRDDTDNRINMTPRSMTIVERQTLALLHRILARLVTDDDSDRDKAGQLALAEALESGFTSEYDNEFSEIEPELSTSQCRFVMDVLDLFREINDAIEQLQTRSVPISADLVSSLGFHGFDMNDPLESHMLRFALFMLRQERWTDLAESFDREHENGNSHLPMKDVYQRMIDEYEDIKAEHSRKHARWDYYRLELPDLERLAQVRIHPSHRRESGKQSSRHISAPRVPSPDESRRSA